MKINRLPTCCLAFWFGLSFTSFEPARAQGVNLPGTSCEVLPVLKAREILRADVLNGPHHKVREEVPTFSGANLFTIDSDFGVFEAAGNAMLVKRINEINAIARLREVSRTDQYKNALAKAAKGPLGTAKNMVEDPVNTIKRVPKGVMKFMKGAGESIKNIGKENDSDAYSGSKMEQIIGYAATKRKVAIALGVDPYSSNMVLQHELEGIAWASFAGGATFSLATLPIGGGAGIALTTAGVQGKLEDVLRDKSPADLKLMNRGALVKMGATEREADRFLSNDAFSPTAQTAFVLNLQSLDGVDSRGAFVRLAGETSSSEADAIFFVQTAGLMSKLHQGEKPLARIALVENFPICFAKDGTVIVALQWDYAAWTKLAANFAKEIQAQRKDKAACLVAISGLVSPRLRQELEALDYSVEDRAEPGPLK